MTIRERKAPGGASTFAPAHGAAPAVAPQANGHPGADARASRTLCWLDWLECASPAQRAALLEVAARPGFVFANQIPPLAQGLKKKPDLKDSALPSPLGRLFAGHVADLPAIASQSVEFMDDQLDAAQREAVTRAVATPDVFLLQGLPGTGRSRVVAEIVHQAARRRQRVLFLAHHAAALDVVLRRLRQSPDALAVRFLARDECLESLAADIVSLTPTAQQKSFIEQAQRNARAALAEARRQHACRQAELDCWARLCALADGIEQIQQKIEQCGKVLDHVAADVHHEAAAGMLGEPYDGAARRLDEAHREDSRRLNADLEDLTQRRLTPAAEYAALSDAIQRLRPLADAKRAGRWWTRAWWRAMWRGRISVKLADLEKRRCAVDAALQALDHSQREIEEKRTHLEASVQASQQHVLDLEIERRRHEIARRSADCQEKLDTCMQNWHLELGALAVPDHRPTEPTKAAVAIARARWEDQLSIDTEACAFAEHWTDFWTARDVHSKCQIADWANVAAGTTAWCQDAMFTQAGRGSFDLLVLEGADQFTEGELLELARHAPRWVFVTETHSLPARPVQYVSAPSAPSHLPARLSGFHALWQQVAGEAHPLGYTWSCEGDRLCATLRPLTAQDRSQLEIERLADFPEIELRILAIAKAPPVVAQVAFPPALTIQEAKRFIYRELEEVAVEGWRFGAWLAENPESIVLHWRPIAVDGLECHELEPGLREWFVPASAQTCRFEFVRAAGWTRPRVDQWLGRYLQIRDSGRCLALRVPYRLSTGLAEPLSDILFAGAYAPASLPCAPSGFEFVPVPSSAQSGEGRKRLPASNGCAPLPREGAGLEQDLALPRGADRIPGDLRAVLPKRGFANFLEAQAMIAKLEQLLTEADSDLAPIAVIALYDGQVELLRRLADRSPTLCRQPSRVIFGLASAFKECECPTVLVSLTRSHSHRAVPIGDRGADMVHALTRSSRHLFVFGDPGALAKRSQWQGPLDHLDAEAAMLEAQRATALLRWYGASLRKPAGADRPHPSRDR